MPINIQNLDDRHFRTHIPTYKVGKRGFYDSSITWLIVYIISNSDRRAKHSLLNKFGV